MTSGDLAERLGLKSPPTFGILAACMAERRPGEDLLEVARRLLTFEALLSGEGLQKHAAEVMGITARRLDYIMSDLRWRPLDRKNRLQ